ncbi:MAG: polyribonucleotide nucleotidyltransferase [Candidatus Omnitrophica bacterium]|nr:polyribonucleotide nucleotidyltransferase [Candidatus Omnitrophota bacterium]
MTNSNIRRVSLRCGKEDLVLETGRLAKQADGSVAVQYGGSLVLVSAVISPQPKAGVDFLPLTVEYQERTYAAGRIPGGFFKREGRPSEKEILTSRLVDRPIRPLFPEGFRNEVQVIAFVLSHDGSNDPDVAAVIGASTALGLAGAPILRVGACRVGRVNGEFVVNPTYAELEQGDLDLLVVASRDGVVMVEAGAKEVPESVMVEALRLGQEQALKTVALQEDLIAGSAKSRQFELQDVDKSFLDRVRQAAGPRVDALLKARSEKEGGESGQKQLVADILAEVQNPESTVTEAQVREAIDALEKEAVRQAILSRGQRVDGRDLTTVRPITCEVGVLPRTHGSGLFTRGQTQGLVSTTLGTGADEQMIDALPGKWYKSFMLHYNFPPFSVGEVRPMRGAGRREIGHGALAEKSLRAVMPTKDEFPYTVRVVSEILESNGSSSMASVCGATLSLMDAGVTIKAPVSGVAMGLIKEGEKFKILTDIMGLEDHYGDMDFKVAGTARGVTALQLDLKLTGVPVELLAQALEQAGPARSHILQKMLEAIAAPRPELSPYAPRITVLKINPEKIGELIGPGGKNIRRITQETGATIDVEDDGTVKVASADPTAAKKAVEYVSAIAQEAEIGKVYQGTVKRITNFGAFCEIAPGKEGLCHVSELSDQFVPKVEDVVKLGDTLAVKVVEIDSQGRINLSHKQALLPEGTPPVPPARRPSSGGDRDRGDRPGGGERGRHGDDRGFRRSGGGGGFRRGGPDRERRAPHSSAGSSHSRS